MVLVYQQDNYDTKLIIIWGVRSREIIQCRNE